MQRCVQGYVFQRNTGEEHIGNICGGLRNRLRQGADIRYSDGVTLKNVRIRQSVGEGFVLANCRNVTMTGCSDASSDGTVSVKKYNSSDVTVE